MALTGRRTRICTLERERPDHRYIRKHGADTETGCTMQPAYWYGVKNVPVSHNAFVLCAAIDSAGGEVTVSSEHQSQ